MSRAARRSATTFIRIMLFAAVMVGPVGAYAYGTAGDGAKEMTGAGFVLYVSLQRNAG